MVEQLAIGALFAAVVSVLSYHTRFLTIDGSIAQFVLGFVLLGFGGWQWTIPIVTFFILSSLLSHVGQNRREHSEEFFEKKSRRDCRYLGNGNRHHLSAGFNAGT